jgi:hypothetical protein
MIESIKRGGAPLVSAYEMVLKVVSVEINCAINDDVFLPVDPFQWL